MRDRLVALILAGCSLPLAADEWIRPTTPHFELFTTAGEKKGREAILYFFEQVRNFFLQAWPSRQVPVFPVRIIAFKSEKQYRPYRFNEAAIAYYTRTRTRDYIVMEDIAPEHYKVAIHEYTHLIIEHAGLKLPLWMNEDGPISIPRSSRWGTKRGLATCSQATCNRCPRQNGWT